MMAGKRDGGRIRQLSLGAVASAVPRPGRHAPDSTTHIRAETGASTWPADKRAEINRDEWIDPDAGKVTFSTYATTWIKECDLAYTTAERYDGILRNHIETAHRRTGTVRDQGAGCSAVVRGPARCRRRRDWTVPDLVDS
jgi:hypothetical protein